jgi:hypothetical protein
MATTIITKNSSTAGAAPTSSDLVQGELAVNVTDKRLYTENGSGTVVELGTNPTALTVAKGSSNGITIGDTTTNSNSVLRMQGTSAGKNWQIANNLNVAGLEFTPSTADGGTTYTTPAVTMLSSGNLLVGTTSTVNPGGVTGTSSFKTTSSSKWAGAFENSASSSPWGVGVAYTGAAPNGTSNAFFYGTDTGGDRFFMRSNGGLANYSANNANLSDERTKTDIQNAGGYLAKICAIPVRTFKYKDQTDDLLNLGVIAQEVEAVAPELVDVSGFGETPEDGVPLKAIYQTDLQYALMKCIQEQQALIVSLTARIEALEAA